MPQAQAGQLGAAVGLAGYRGAFQPGPVGGPLPNGFAFLGLLVCLQMVFLVAMCP